MNDQPVHDLTLADQELFALLAEECSEVVKICMKILRHGLHSHHPISGESNYTLLQRELGDVRAATQLLVQASDLELINDRNLADRAEEKLLKVGKYLHHTAITPHQARLMSGKYVFTALDRFRDGLNDMAEHGVRFDMNPTQPLADERRITEFFLGYIQRINESVKDKAKGLILAEWVEAEAEDGCDTDGFVGGCERAHPGVAHEDFIALDRILGKTNEPTALEALRDAVGSVMVLKTDKDILALGSAPSRAEAIVAADLKEAVALKQETAGVHNSHKLHFSSSSLYDDICVLCGANDGSPEGEQSLKLVCPGEYYKS